tara:strand:- start:79 stop:498 length:420 start_codon:yes stop_codon:yes gene_type:complete
MAELIQRSKATKSVYELMIFKSKKDLMAWRSNTICKELSLWLALANAISMSYFHRPIRVTAITKAGPFHQDTEAADISAISAGDEAFFGDKTWTKDSANKFERLCLNQGVPLIRVGKGKESEHWHIGCVATLIYQVGDE